MCVLRNYVCIKTLKLLLLKLMAVSQGANAYNPSTWEAEGGRGP